MAVKITHLTNGQQVRFANADGARRYAEIMGGGVDKWRFTVVPADRPAGFPAASLQEMSVPVVNVPVWRMTSK
ncbi:hypothetical protein ACFWY9_04940 [Amycolatopsis sp. NPDC059027]|uniref:hypothetical protein n=1 Tax=unclassified Amycolatopsis TaxID=2618356 RepID=UPI003671DD73